MIATESATDPGEPPTATLRRSPEDFVVDELPAYEASGSGEHLLVTFRKTGLTTLQAVERIARALEVDPRGAGYAGMKDRHAVTTQTASFPVPMAVDAERAVAAVAVAGVEVLAARRHVNKLKPGHLLGNRFRLVLRDLAPGAAERIRAGLEALCRTGVPNAFGAQRFGRDGDNPERALAWLRGDARGPRDRREQRLLFSALQSLLFNEVLERREADGTWRAALPGDLAKRHDSGGLFLVPAEGPETEDARVRAEEGALSATGPMFGAKMRWPEGAPLALEREILERTLGGPDRLVPHQKLGEGTRRPLRMMVSDLTTELVDDGSGLGVGFVLPKGGYATTVLGRVCRFTDARGGAGVAPTANGDEPPLAELASEDASLS